MQLFEVKNDIAKIAYNPAENNLLPSDFLLIEDVNQKLIAQILNISTNDSTNNNVADVRLALSIDKSDNLSYYNGYIPSKLSTVLYINPNEITELIKGTDDCIYFGNLTNHQDCFVQPSLSFLNDKLYIQSDRDDKTKIIFKNILSELNSKQKNIVLIDFNGNYSDIKNVPRIKISDSFKLPLNIDAFNTILEFDTTDCPIEDKAVIQSIVLELREYLKTLDNAFLPFTLFKNVIDNEFMANPISGLMLLRNKLWLYAQDGIFAENKSQFEIINTILENQNALIIDASDIEEKWYKFTIITIMNLLKKYCYLGLSLNDVNLDKKTLISLYNKSNIIPIVSTTYDSKYRQNLTSLCKNQVLFKPSTELDNTSVYSTLLNKINSTDFIIYGESTLYLPLILELQEFNSKTAEHVVENEIKKDVDKFLSSQHKIIPNEPIITESLQAEAEFEDENILFDDDSNDSLALNDDFEDSDLDYIDSQNEKPITIEDIRNAKEQPQKEPSKYDVFAPMSVQESYNNTDKKYEESTYNIGPKPVEIVKKKYSASELNDLDRILLDDSDVVDELQEPENELLEEDNINNNTDIDISNDDEEQYDNIVNSEYEEKELEEYNEEKYVEKESTEEDLELELEEDEEIAPPEIKENINTNESKELPVYETDISVNSPISDLPFKIGDRVYHPKHGAGVIEGFANYSNKILFCHIEFENVGRRILDPRIAGIEKIS